MPASKMWREVARVAASYVVLAGLLLTFSRSSIIALLVVLPVFWLSPLFSRSGWSGSGIRKLGRRAGIGLVYAAALGAVFPITYEFYGELIFSRYSNAVEQAIVDQHVPSVVPAVPVEPQPPATVSEPPVGPVLSAEVPGGSVERPVGYMEKIVGSAPDVFVSDGSEGTRLAIWSAVIKHTLAHPWLGSGYLGSWTLDTVTTGSAHNQYFDVLMRTGLLGLAIYLLILAQVFIFLWRKQRDLFWGGLAVLVYGLFHETFKESQGAFILAFLIGMYATYRRQTARAPEALADMAPVK